MTQAKDTEEKKSVRIRNEDHKKLKTIAFFNEKSIMDVISEATSLIEQKYDSK